MHIYKKAKLECKKGYNPKKYANRPSPPYSAKYCANMLQYGNDGKKWISLKDKNGVWKWKRFKDTTKTSSAKEFVSQFGILPKYNITPTLNKLKILRKELYKYKIYYIYVSWKISSDFIDIAWDYAKSILRKLTGIDRMHIVRKLSFIIQTEYTTYMAQTNKKLYLQHNVINKKHKQIIIDIFKKYFGKKFVWNGRNSQALLIKT